MMPVHSETLINYIQVGDYFIPELTLPRPSKPIEKWGRIYREFLKDHHPVQYNSLILSGQLWELLAQIDEQIQDPVWTEQSVKWQLQRQSQRS